MVRIQLSIAYHPKSQGFFISKIEFLFFFYLTYKSAFLYLIQTIFSVKNGSGLQLSAFFPPTLSFSLYQRRSLTLLPKFLEKDGPIICTMLKMFQFTTPLLVPYCWNLNHLTLTTFIKGRVKEVFKFSLFVSFTRFEVAQSKRYSICEAIMNGDGRFHFMVNSSSDNERKARKGFAGGLVQSIG